MKRGMLVLVLVGLLGGTAEAQTTVTTPGPYQRWVLESRMPSAAERVEVIESACPGAIACTSPFEQRIYIDRSATFHPRPTFWHELGHRFDYQALTRQSRHRFMHLMGFPPVGWRQQFGPYTNDTGAERFATIYAVCAERQPRLEKWRTGCRFISAQAKRNEYSA